MLHFWIVLLHFCGVACGLGVVGELMAGQNGSMKPPDDDSLPPMLDLATCAVVCGSAVRLGILRELGKGAALPVHELARRLHRGPQGVSDHCRKLLTAGVVTRGYGDLYQLADRFVSADGRLLDLGAVKVALV